MCRHCAKQVVIFIFLLPTQEIYYITNVMTPIFVTEETEN